MTTNPYRSLPSTDRLMQDERLRAATSELGAAIVTEAARRELAEQRAGLAAGAAAATLDAIVEAAVSRAYAALRPTLRRVINATGVVIHTNLGRAPLSDATLAAMVEAGRDYSNLEFDLDSGSRGSRYTHLEELLKSLTGAEAAMGVNNNASALLLALSALAHDREVIISRGQLVEIGGGFRIPDVMAQSNARLVEVGTTNRTRLADYEAAITDASVALMRVHASNFKIIGFVEAAEPAAMSRLAHERGLLLLDDLGSGCLLDTRRFGLAAEPTPQESIGFGADLVLFSGDKLLGGPQAGLIVGKAELVGLMKRHPLARALRLDKTSIAGLNATLLHYLRGEAEDQVPVWRMIAAPQEELDRRAAGWMKALGHGRVIDGRSMVGGGSLPEESLPSRLLALPPEDGLSPDFMSQRLRTADPAVVARVEHDQLLLDPRTVHPRDDEEVVRALTAAVRPAP